MIHDEQEYTLLDTDGLYNKFAIWVLLFFEKQKKII